MVRKEIGEKMGRINKNYTIVSKFEYKNGKENETITDLWSVYTSNDVYKKIFNKRLKNEKKYPWTRKILKIYSKDTKISIYRIWRGVPPFLQNSKDILFIDKNAKYALTLPNHNQADIVLSKGNKFLFYWYHYDNATRVSFKLGFVSVMLGIISIVFALTPSIKQSYSYIINKIENVRMEQIMESEKNNSVPVFKEGNFSNDNSEKEFPED